MEAELKFSDSVIALAAAVLAVTPVATYAQESNTNGIPFEWAPWKDPNNPNVLIYKDSKDDLFARRDTSDDPERQPGLFYPNRYVTGPLWNSIPTFMGAPIAMSPEDLVAGEVDVALVGLSIGDQMLPGGRFAAMKMRSLTDYLFYPFQGTDQALGVDISELVVADYGTIAANWMADNQTNLDEVHKVLSEIINAGTVPIGIGGTHIQSYAFMTALGQKHGPGEVAVLHIDAHYDAYSKEAGNFVHNGSFFKLAVDSGLLDGAKLHHIGLRGSTPDYKDLKWMRENKLRFHFQTEIEKDGWDAVLARLLGELKGMKLYVSFDMDGVDPAYAPGVGTSEPGGLTAEQAIQLMRAVGIQNEIVAAEFNEYNPFLDDAHQSTGILMDRLARSLMAGMQGRREGIKDPLYFDPERILHNGGDN